MIDISGQDFTQWPSVVSQGKFIVVSYTKGNTRGGIGVSISVNAGDTWTKIDLTGQATDFRPNLIIQDNYAYIVWSDASSGDTKEVKLCKLNLITFEKTYTTVTSTNGQTNSPTIVSNNQKFYVFYTIRTEVFGKLYCNYSDDGIAWQTETSWQVQGGINTLVQGVQGVVYCGKLYIVWAVKGKSIDYAIQNNSSWQYGILHSGVNYWPAISKQNGIKVAWQNGGTGAEILTSNYNGHWSTPVNISNSEANSFYPKLIDNTVVWAEVKEQVNIVQLENENYSIIAEGTPTKRQLWPDFSHNLIVWQGEQSGNPFRIWAKSTYQPFNDLDNCVFKTEIEHLNKLGVLNKSLSYNPNIHATRAEFASMLVKYFHYTNYNPFIFDDVPTTHPDYENISIASSEGIIKGQNNKFRPDDEIRRDELAVMIRRSKKYPLINPEVPYFLDVPKEHIFYKEIETLRALNIIKGTNNNVGWYYYPSTNIMRGELCAILSRTGE